jgi:hypothetical protein
MSQGILTRAADADARLWICFAGSVQYPYQAPDDYRGFRISATSVILSVRGAGICS